MQFMFGACLKVRKSEESALVNKNLFIGSMLRFSSKFLDQMLGRIEFFQKNIQYRYAMLEKLSTHMFELSFKSSLQIPQHSLYTALKKEFGNKLGDYDVLIPLLCAIINKYQKNIEEKNKQIAELKNQSN